MRNKGIYGMLTAFILTAVILFVVLGLIYLNSVVLSQEGELFEGIKPFEIAFDAKTKIIEADYCFGGKITEAKLDENAMLENCATKIFELSNKQITGFSVERLEHLDCNSSKKPFGNLENCTQKFVFFANIEKGYKKCLGKMLLCTKLK